MHIDIDKFKKLRFAIRSDAGVIKGGQRRNCCIGTHCNWNGHRLLVGNSPKNSVYRPLKNKQFDKLMIKMRGRFGSRNIPLNSTAREIVKLTTNRSLSWV